MLIIKIKYSSLIIVNEWIYAKLSSNASKKKIVAERSMLIIKIKYSKWMKIC
jgi:hypothetical protein